MSRKLTPWFIGGFLLGIQSAAWALGLGEIQLMSKLNEPLRARIPLVSVGDLNREQILAKIAPMEDFERAGIEYSFQLNRIRFNPVILKDGTAYLELTTQNPVKEPLLDMLIDVSWPNGRLQREYALLLDPPTFDDRQAQPVRVPGADAQGSVTSAPVSAWEGQTIGEYGPVNPNDTLWKIAKRVRPSTRVTIHQTMVALYHANPGAFADNNMNNLLKGKVLKIPAESEIAAIDQEKALLEIVHHNQVWGQAGKGRPASRPIGAVDVGQYAASSGSESPKARLKLDVPKDKNGAALAQAEEALATLKSENEALKAQVEEANERLAKMEKLLALKDEELARLSQQKNELTADDIESSANTEQDLEANGVTQESENDSQDRLGQIEDEGAASSEFTNEAQETENSTQLQQVQTTSQPDKKTPPQTVKKPETAQSDESHWSDIFVEYWTLWVGGLAASLIAIFAILLIRRRKMEETLTPITTKIEDSTGFAGGDDDDLDNTLSSLSADDLLASEDADYIPEDAVDALQEHAQDEAPADPIGEADVYMAYGKFEQARQVLKQALASEPDRVDLQLKLMECLAELKEKEEFERHKEALRPVLLSDQVVQEKVKELENKAWPDEFETGSKDQGLDDAFADDDIFGDLAFTSDLPEEQAMESAEDTNIGNEAAEKENLVSDADDGDLDWSLDSELDFESDTLLDSEDEDSVSTETAEVESTGTTSEDREVLSEEGLGELTLGELGSDDDELSLDLEDDIASSETESDDTELELGDVDEVSTKLDLARAYLDMEDYDGARDILNEVLEEGNDAQKQEAQKMLEQI